jgi:hypothetical protein
VVSVELKKEGLYQEDGQRLATLAQDYACSPAAKGYVCLWEPYEGGVYIGRFRIVESVEPGQEAEAQAALDEFTQKDEVAAILEPSVWARLWAFFAKTKE